MSCFTYLNFELNILILSWFIALRSIQKIQYTLRWKCPFKIIFDLLVIQWPFQRVLDRLIPIRNDWDTGPNANPNTNPKANPNSNPNLARNQFQTPVSPLILDRFLWTCAFLKAYKIAFPTSPRPAYSDTEWLRYMT